MKNRIFAFDVILQVIKLPNDSTKCDRVLRGFVEGDESRALIAGTTRHQQMQGDRQDIFIQVEVEDSPEDFFHVDSRAAFQFLRKELALLAREVGLIEVPLQLLGQFHRKNHGQALQRVLHLILGLIGKIGIGRIGDMMQDYTLTIEKAEIELLSTHGQVQGLTLSLSVLFHIIYLDLLKITQLDIPLRCPGEYPIAETILWIEDKVLAYLYVGVIELGSQHQRHEHLRTIPNFQEQIHFLSGQTVGLIDVIPYLAAKGGVAAESDSILIREATLLALFCSNVADSAEGFFDPSPTRMQLRGKFENMVVDGQREEVGLVSPVEGDEGQVLQLGGMGLGMCGGCGTGGEEKEKEKSEGEWVWWQFVIIIGHQY